MASYCALPAALNRRVWLRRWKSIAQTVSGLQAGMIELDVRVYANGDRLDGSLERGKRATAALVTAGRALVGFADSGN